MNGRLNFGLGLQLGDGIRFPVGGASAVIFVPGPLAAGTASIGTVGQTSIALSATDATGGVLPYAYQWERSLNGGTTWSVLAGATTRSFTNTELSPSTTYHYRLIYTDASTGTVTSNVVSATTLAATVPLAAGTVTIGTVTQTSIAASATDATNGTLPYTYAWQIAPNSGGLPGAWTPIAGANSLSVNATGLNPQTAYWLRLAYTDAASATAFSVPVMATTLAVPLAAGTATATSTSSSAISLSATDAAGGTLPYSYQWQRSINSGASWVALTGATSRSIVNSGLSPSTTYQYRLIYTDASAGSVVSNVVSATTIAAPVPGSVVEQWFSGDSGEGAIGVTIPASTNAEHWFSGD